MKKNLLLVCLFIFSQQNLFAIHNRGGEIIYRHLQGFEYEITITTYTKATATAADRPVLDSIHLGDNTVVSIPRYNILVLPNDIKRNRYITTHTYPGQGIYRIYFIDPNRCQDIVNMNGSVNVPMCIDAYLVAFDASQYCVNNSVVFDTIPIFFGQLNRPFTHNLTARDPDHDSLSYELISPMMALDVAASGYYVPNNFSLNTISGQVKWNTVSGNPQGEFSFAVRINEWRNGYKVGYVMREFQIAMLPTFPDTLNFFSPLSLSVDATGNYFVTVNPGDTVNVQAVYYYSSVSNPPITTYGEALLMSNAPVVQYSTGSGTAIADFSWIPDAAKSRLHPYVFQFRGTSTSQRQSDLTFLVYVNGTATDTCPAFPFVGINELHNQDGINIYPNPAENQLAISSGQFAISEIEIYDVVGKKVFRKQLPTNNYQLTIDVSGLTNGIYFVKVKTKDGIKTQKLIVQH